MLRRIMDPTSSTRRTEAARRRLAEHPMTTALLDAGVRLLLAEIAPAPSAPSGEAPARLFAGLTAQRVCAAATRRGPLRVTAGHLRDRWPLHDDFVSDLVAYGLWELHWADLLGASSDLVPGADAGADLAADPAAVLAQLAAGLAEINLYDGRTAVTHRLELVMASTAASRPALRSHRQRSYAHLDASGGSTFAAMFHRVGMRLRPGRDHGELTVAFGALAEGANLRLLVRPADPAARTAALRTIAVAGQLLADRYWSAPAPVPAPPAAEQDDDEPPAPWSRPAPPPPRLEDVLERLTDPDPERAVRRTEGARRRLAADAVTRQLLEGGLAVLAEDFEITPRPGGSRIFDALSASRVVEEALRAGGAGAGASRAQLRDRWVLQEHYVDDLVHHALQHRASVVDALAGGHLDEPAATAAVARHLHAVQQGDATRLRLLVTTLASARPGVSEQLAQLDDDEQRALAELLRSQLDARGWEPRPGVDLEEVAGWLLALGDGVEVRLLATGGAPDAVGDGSMLARTGFELLRACCRPRTAGTA